MDNLAIKVEDVYKEYRLGAIGGSTLRGDLQSWWAKARGKDDPNSKLTDTVKGNKGDKFLALNGVSFEVKKGEVLGIIGHNGAGKSTLLKLLSRVTAPSKGTISYNGRIASMLEIGTGFHPELSGRENIYMNGAILGMTKAEITKKFDEIVEFAEMKQFIDTPVKRYSSGMYVKLAFAVAAHLDSEIMIMDEVLAVGDAKFQQKCLGKMGDASRDDGRTVLYVSHQMHTIKQLCTRCIVLDRGKIIYDGNVDEAIGLYMGLMGDVQKHYEFDCDAKLNLPINQLCIKSLDLLDTDKQKYEKDDTVNIKLNVLSNADYKDVGVRFVVKYQDGTVAGAMLSDKTFDVAKGKEKNVMLAMKTAGLTPGKYVADVVLYKSNTTGFQEKITDVSPGFVFEIDDFAVGSNQLSWQHQYWGHIQLSNIEIKG